MRKSVCLLYSLLILKHVILENQIFCEPYAASVYHVNRLYECFNGDSIENELSIERENVHAFDRENGNPVLDTIYFIIYYYKGKLKIVTDEYGRNILYSHIYQMVGQNASDFDNHIVLNS